MKRTRLERGAPPQRKTPLRKVNRKRRKRLYSVQFGGYADRIRAMPCLVCGGRPADPHHVVHRNRGGTWRDLIPLDRKCHEELHRIGKRSFEAKSGVSLHAEAERLAKEKEER